MKNLFFNSNGQMRPGYLLMMALLIAFTADVFAGILTIFAYYFFPDASMYTFIGSAPSTIIYALVYGSAAWFLSKIILNKFLSQDDLSMIDCFSFKKRTLVHLGAGMLLGIIAFAATVLPLYLTGQYVLAYNGIEIVPLMLYFVFFISVGVVEEITTRGIMQHTMMRYGKWMALIITGFIFAAMHLLNPNVTFASLFGIFIAGIFLGMSMYATGSLTVAIGAHITWNWVQSTVLGIPVSGLDIKGNVFQTTIVGTNELITGGRFGAEASLSCFIALAVISFVFYLRCKKRELSE
ncbi:MAG: CPBP family intramembrane metalloprotease [Lachnospiraceae bacterium]|nr:CPBP family intramembrane metalloprotease [Lachnospiraceae bacterium]